jgi:hypothetical protein
MLRVNYSGRFALNPSKNKRSLRFCWLLEMHFSKMLQTEAIAPQNAGRKPSSNLISLTREEIIRIT